MNKRTGASDVDLSLRTKRGSTIKGAADMISCKWSEEREDKLQQPILRLSIFLDTSGLRPYNYETMLLYPSWAVELRSAEEIVNIGVHKVIFRPVKATVTSSKFRKKNHETH